VKPKINCRLSRLTASSDVAVSCSGLAAAGSCPHLVPQIADMAPVLEGSESTTRLQFLYISGVIY
jgi:hypothetical protein